MASLRTQSLWRFIRPFRRHLVGLLGLTAFLSVLGLLPPLVTRYIIDQVITRGERALFVPLAVALIALPALAAIISQWQHRWIAYIGQRFVLGIRATLFDHFMALSIRFFHHHNTGKLISRLMEDSGVVQNLVTASSVQILSDLITALVSLGVAFMINWQLALVLLVVVVAFTLNYRLNVSRIRVAARRFRGSQDRMAGGLTNRLTGNLTVKTYGMEAREHAVFQGESDQAAFRFEESVTINNTFNMNTSLLQGLSHALVFFVGCAMVLRNTATYGDVVAFTAYTMQLLWPAVRFSLISQQIQDVSVSADRLLELLAEPCEVTSPPHGLRVNNLRGNVDFDQVHFHYEEGKPVLRGLDLHVAAGSSIALVGPTGCGKTTVLSLLLRFYDVSSGAIRIDGMDLRDMDLHSLRRQFGVVLQESLLFHISVADNIRYARPDATMDEVRDAARMAEIHTDIEALPQGYDTLLGAQGVELSIGQKQRLNIARAVLVNPPMLIMDEATSSLDSESERAIQTALDHFLQGRTSFIVAHRLSTIRNADRIILLDEGGIVEMGNHNELMAIRNGRYRHLYESHAAQGVLGEGEG
ncbi:MAG: ABC transporter ATP-binding protein [Lentisphaerae bacterium]|nr:ABC transporter ATP-binding protein [Lentisphaerota bacterium]